MTPDALADRLRETGALVSPDWDRAVRAVPRHVFVPRFVEQRADLTWRTVSGDDRRDEWLAAVYADRALVTALRADVRGRPEPVSSSSAPGLMVRMLETLELCDGHRVLEIGTGTGYNAGLLAHRLGSENVASVDVEATLVDAARDRLAELGRHPALAVTDGVLGLPERAPYDRIVATCAVPRVPPAWLDQLAPDGRVLTDLTIAGGAGNLVDLRATSSGLEGRFLAR